MDKWHIKLEKGVSLFDKYLDYIKSTLIFAWKPMEKSLLQNVTIMHCSQLYEYNSISCQLECYYYILTTKFIIKLKVIYSKE